jgi:hypothetical protein
VAVAALLADAKGAWDRWQQHARAPVLTHGDSLAAIAARRACSAAGPRALALGTGAEPRALHERLEAAVALQRALGGLWYLARGEAVRGPLAAALASGAGSGQTTGP